MTNKEKYSIFCEQDDFVPIFSQPWWLDAVCVDGFWDVLLYEKDGQVLGALPYYVKKRWGLAYITQPQFTQNNGVIIRYPKNQRYEKKLSYEKEVMLNLIEQLEILPIVFYKQSFNCKYTNWLPFYWKDFKQTTCYTYRIEDISNMDSVIGCFSYNKRSDLKTAERNNLTIMYNLSIESFYEYHSRTLEKVGKQPSYSQEFLNKLWLAIDKNNAGAIMGIKDENNIVHSGILLVWDKMIGYNLMTFFDPEYRKSRSSVLLFKEAIAFIANKVNVFDFEGSMVESIENSYRKFGTVQIPYFQISKIFTKNPFFCFMISKKLG